MEANLFGIEGDPTPEPAPAPVAAKPKGSRKKEAVVSEEAPAANALPEDLTPLPSPSRTSASDLPEAERGRLQNEDLPEGERFTEAVPIQAPLSRHGGGGLAAPGIISLVTGSSRGIGRGIAIELGRLGHTVVINYAGNEAAAAECLQMVRDSGGDGIIVQGDVSQEADRERMVQTVIDTYGRIDLLVNNAGVAPNVRADILEAGEESFDRLININLKGPYFLTQRVAKQMIAQVEANLDDSGPRPQIVTVSSISAYTASTNRGDYCISKAGLGMMTALWAARLAEWGIRVYEIRPGVIATDMTGGVKEKYDKMIEDGVWPINRWGEPSDIGRAVAAIARGDFPFSTGEVFNVDGGFHLRTL